MKTTHAQKVPTCLNTMILAECRDLCEELCYTKFCMYLYDMIITFYWCVLHLNWFSICICMFCVFLGIKFFVNILLFIV
jgi:hypothetical protein